MAITMDGIFVNGQKATFHPEDILSGDASAYTQEIGTAVEEWMEENVTGGEQVTDTTLTLPGVPADAEKTGDEIEALKEDLTQTESDVDSLETKIYGEHVTIEYVSNQYVSNDGTFKNYSNWSRTNFVPVPSDGADLVYANNGTASSYCAFYSDATESSFLQIFSIQKTQTGQQAVPNGAKFFAVSNYTPAISSFKYLNPPTSIGIVDDIANLYAIIPEVPKVVMSYKLIALQDEQFDIHYDNIFVNFRGDDIPYKEVFGSFSGIGMRSLIRLQSNVVGTTTGGIRYRNSITGAFNSPTLPDNVLKQSFAIQTISKTSGIGVTRKVILIGDSWTAPGLYARELRTLFEDEDEPMNITLLGTLGNGGAYVGPESGYHEGHGAFSAKTFCTMASKNGYANAFYNPTTETFDFAYYMNNCGYSAVDDVFINLGINDVEEVQDFDESIGYWNTMISSIKTFDSNIKVFIGLCGLPAQYEYGTHNNNCNRSKARRLLFHERLIAEYGDRENEGIIVVPLHLSIDPEHDFPVTQMARSFRDSTLVDYCTDYVHPAIIAYNKIADRIRTYIKYAETL